MNDLITRIQQAQRDAAGAAVVASIPRELLERILAKATTLRPPQKAYFLDDDSDRLRPCPFCGGDAEFDEIIEGQDTGSHFVQCTSSACGASSARIFPLMDDVKALLLERWNKRHTRL